MIGRSNRAPSARPRVQSSNGAEEELPPKTAKIGHRNTQRARPAYFPKTILLGPPLGAGILELLVEAETVWGGGEKRGCGKFKKMGKALPFFLSPYPVDFWTNASFSDEEHSEGAALSNSHLGENAMALPQGRSGPASWILRSVRDPGFALPCPPWSWIYHQFRIAWLRCVVWMDGRAPQVQSGQSSLPAKAASNATALQDQA